jgi:hypothetical protein
MVHSLAEQSSIFDFCLAFRTRVHAPTCRSFSGRANTPEPRVRFPRTPQLEHTYCTTRTPVVARRSGPMHAHGDRIAAVDSRARWESDEFFLWYEENAARVRSDRATRRHASGRPARGAARAGAACRGPMPPPATFFGRPAPSPLGQGSGSGGSAGVTRDRALRSFFFLPPPFSQQISAPIRRGVHANVACVPAALHWRSMSGRLGFDHVGNSTAQGASELSFGDSSARQQRKGIKSADLCP